MGGRNIAMALRKRQSHVLDFVVLQVLHTSFCLNRFRLFV